jgi:hypothetical protein
MIFSSTGLIIAAAKEEVFLYLMLMMLPLPVSSKDVIERDTALLP